MPSNFLTARKWKHTVKRVAWLCLILIALSALTYGIKHIRFAKKEPKPVENIQPIAVIAGFGISQDGRIMKRMSIGNLPVIYADVPALYGGEQLQGKAIETTLSFINALTINNLSVKDIDIYNEQYMDLTLSTNIQIIYNSSIEPNALGSSLQSIVSLFTIEGKAPKSIDVRFQKPVAVF